MPEARTTVRAFPHPALTEGNLSFPDGEYVPSVYPGEGGFVAHVKHQIQKAPFIENAIKEKKAVCSCVVSVPITGYRKVFLGKDGEYDQIVEWDKDSIGQPPILQPLVVWQGEESNPREFKREDGVHDMWIGQPVTLPKGAKIAVGQTFRMVSSMESLLFIENSGDDTGAQMRVIDCAEDGFYFKVKVRPDLYRFLQSPGDDDYRLLRRSILIHAVSCCFSILSKDYKESNVEEDSWEAHTNLRILYAEMERKGIKTWDDDDFFPEEAATSMWPHFIPSQEPENV